MTIVSVSAPDLHKAADGCDQGQAQPSGEQGHMPQF